MGLKKGKKTLFLFTQVFDYPFRVIETAVNGKMQFTVESGF